MSFRLTSFFYLNTAQVFIVLNDSIFRLIVAYSLIDFLGESQANNILAISAALFVLPFILFIMPAGQLADKFSKRSVILVTLVAEIIFMVIAFFAISYKDPFTSYLSLFLIALQAAVFSPAKYSIIPEIKPKEKLARVNGFFTLTVYFTIITGTFLASFLSDLTDRNYPFIVLLCLIFSILALLSALKIEKTPAQNPMTKVRFFFPPDIYKNLKIATLYPPLFLTIISSACFLFTAGYTQLNLITFGIQSLHITDVQTGYIFLGTSLGLGLGALTVAFFSPHRIRLGFSLLGAFGTSFSYISLYFFQHSLIISCLLLFFVGYFGGLFIVPIDAYVQHRSPPAKRGSIIAAGSFLGFFSVFLSSLTLAFFGSLLHLSAATGFLLIGLFALTLSVSLLIFLLPAANRHS